MKIIKKMATNENRILYKKKNGQLHRLNGPAVISLAGGRSWWQHGDLHRADGPAVICPPGENEYWYRGKRYYNITSDREWRRKTKILELEKIIKNILIEFGKTKKVNLDNVLDELTLIFANTHHISEDNITSSINAAQTQTPDEVSVHYTPVIRKLKNKKK